MTTKKATTKKSDSNRKNALKSTGPKTEKGKQVVSKNGLTHGLRSLQPVLPGVESESDWKAHRDAILKQLEPAGAIEQALAERIALSFWRLARCAKAESEMGSEGKIERDWSVVRSELSFNQKTNHKSLPAALENLRELVDNALELTAIWELVCSGANPKRKIAPEIADQILDQAVPRHLWQHLEDQFNEAFNWPPKNVANFREMVIWLAKGCSEIPDTWILTKAKVAATEAYELSTQLNWIDERSLKANDDKLAFLKNGTSEKLMRYETSIHRALQKDLHELQRIQAMRVGMKDVVPVAVDVSD